MISVFVFMKHVLPQIVSGWRSSKWHCMDPSDLDMSGTLSWDPTLNLYNLSSVHPQFPLVPLHPPPSWIPTWRWHEQMWWAFWLRMRSQRSSGASCERSRILGWLPRAIGSPRALDWHFRKIVPWSVSCCHHSASKRPSPVTSPLLSPGVLFKPDFAWYFSKPNFTQYLTGLSPVVNPTDVTFLPWLYVSPLLFPFSLLTVLC